MNRNKILTKTKKNWAAPLAITMAAVLGVTPIFSTPVYAKSAVVSNKESIITGTSSDTNSDDKVTKDETVYVVADSS